MCSRALVEYFVLRLWYEHFWCDFYYRLGKHNENSFSIGGKNANNTWTLPAFGHRLWMTATWITRVRNRGYFQVSFDRSIFQRWCTNQTTKNDDDNTCDVFICLGGRTFVCDLELLSNLFSPSSLHVNVLSLSYEFCSIRCLTFVIAIIPKFSLILL